MGQYNATVYAMRDGEPYGTFCAEVEMIGGRLQMLRANGLQCTGFEGKVGELKAGSELAEKYPGQVALYDVYYRERHPEEVLEIVQDDCAGYRNLIRRMGVPPAYKGA